MADVVSSLPLRLALAGLALLLGLAPSAAAHEGPPFPILVDEPMAPWSVSVWADPDVGVGTFWVLLDPAAGAVLPEDTAVTVHVAPADGREPESAWPATAGGRDGRPEHIAEVDFPTREFWTVRIELTSAATGARAERSLRVEVTPPGYGPIDLLLYSWPFAALALLWLKALSRARARRPAVATPQQTG